MRFLARSRRERLPELVRERAGLGRRERVLAHGKAADDTWLLGTTDALVVLQGSQSRRLPWSEVQAADWDDEERLLTLTEVGTFGEERPRHRFHLEDQGLLLQLVRERVQASVVVQHRVPLQGRRGFTVIGRRGAGGEIAWMVEYDAGVDPADRRVQERVDEALATARDDVGEGPGAAI